MAKFRSFPVYLGLTIVSASVLIHFLNLLAHGVSIKAYLYFLHPSFTLGNVSIASGA